MWDICSFSKNCAIDFENRNEQILVIMIIVLFLKKLFVFSILVSSFTNFYWLCLTRDINSTGMEYIKKYSAKILAISSK